MLEHEPLLDAFVEWFHQLNPVKHKLAVARFPNTGRGIIALEDIKEGELLLSVPEKLLISTKSFLEGSEAEKALLRLDPGVALCTYLLSERAKGDQSFWAPYLKILPSSYDTLLFYSEEELQQLQSTKLAIESRKSQEKLRADYESLRSGLLSHHPQWFPENAFTFELFKWAWGVVQTRACYRAVDLIRGDNSCLVPYADFLNHYSNVETDAHYDEETKTYKFITKTPFKKGEEVFISYGKYGNSSLLTLYGFVIENNSDDMIYLDHPLIEKHLKTIERDDELRKQKEDLIDQLPLTKSFFAKWREISWNFLSVVRILLMRREELAYDNVFAAVFEEKAELMLHEKQVLLFVIELLSALLSSYATTSQRDEEELKANNGSLSYHLRCAIQMRKEEKRILESIVEMSRKSLGEM